MVLIVKPEVRPYRVNPKARIIIPSFNSPEPQKRSEGIKLTIINSSFSFSLTNDFIDLYSSVNPIKEMKLMKILCT